MNEDWKKILDCYPEEKKQWDKTYPWIYFVARPVSFPITWLLHKMGIIANQVTFFTALLGIVSLPLFISGQTEMMIFGACCIVLYNLLDCVDGNLARTWPTDKIPKGKFWDQLVGNFYILLYFAIGIGVNEFLWLVVGAGITIGKYLIEGIRYVFWNVLGKNWEISKKLSNYEPHTGKWYYRVYYNFTDPQAHIFLLPAVIALNWLKPFLAITSIITVLQLIFVTVFYIWRSKKLK